MAERRQREIAKISSPRIRFSHRTSLDSFVKSSNEQHPKSLFISHPAFGAESNSANLNRDVTGPPSSELDTRGLIRCQSKRGIHYRFKTIWLHFHALDFRANAQDTVNLDFARHRWPDVPRSASSPSRGAAMARRWDRDGTVMDALTS